MYIKYFSNSQYVSLVIGIYQCHTQSLNIDEHINTVYHSLMLVQIIIDQLVCVDTLGGKQAVTS